MARCWNCGLPDIAERCPRCGAPQDWPGARGVPPDQPPAMPPAQERRPPAARPPQPFAGGGEREQRRPAPTGWDDPDVYSQPPPAEGRRPPTPRPSGPLPGLRSGQFAPPGAPLRQPSQPFRQPLPEVEETEPPYQAPPGRRGSGMLRPVPSVDPRRGPSQPLAEPPWQAEEPMPPRAGPPPGSYGPAQGRAPAQPPARAYRDEAPPALEPELPLQEGPYAEEPFQEEPASKQSRREKRRQAEREEKLAQFYSPSLWEDEEQQVELSLTLAASLNALLGAAIGGLAGGVLWIALVVLTHQDLPYLTVLVGLLSGLGARAALYETRPLRLGIFAALGAGGAFVLTQYGLLDYALAEAQRQNNLFTSWFPLSLTEFPRVYWDYVTGLPDTVTQAMGQAGAHSLHPLGLLAAMALAWGLLLWRKR